MSGLRMVYLLLALIGAMVPMWHLLPWLAAHGGSAVAMGTVWFENGATKALTWDLILSVVALTLWIVAETRVRRNWIALLAIPATFFIGVSYGLPLYLFLRTRPVA